MQHRHFILHKPYGYLSQFITNQTKGTSKKRMLGELHDFPKGTMCIGRLDEASEGLLLLTTDGMMSEKIRDQSIEKQYFAQVDGLITAAAVGRLKTGVEIGVFDKKYITKPCAAQLLDPAPTFPIRSRPVRDDRHGPTSWVSITLTEGKFRQVRKMTAAVGFPTLRLVRVRVGSIHLAKMAEGDVIEVENFN